MKDAGNDNAVFLPSKASHCAFRSPLSTFHHKPLWSSCEHFLRGGRCEFIMGALITIRAVKTVLLIVASWRNDSPRVHSFPGFLCSPWCSESIFKRWVKIERVLELPFNVCGNHLLCNNPENLVFLDCCHSHFLLPGNTVRIFLNVNKGKNETPLRSTKLLLMAPSNWFLSFHRVHFSSGYLWTCPLLVLLAFFFNALLVQIRLSFSSFSDVRLVVVYFKLLLKCSALSHWKDFNMSQPGSEGKWWHPFAGTSDKTSVLSRGLDLYWKDSFGVLACVREL